MKNQNIPASVTLSPCHLVTLSSCDLKRIGLLVGVTVGAWALTAGPAFFLLDGPPLGITALAAGLCLAPGVLVLLLAGYGRNWAAEKKAVLAFVAPAIRLVLACAGGIVLYYQVPWVLTNGKAFLMWGMGFYLLTLAVETGLLYIDTIGPGSKGSPDR